MNVLHKNARITHIRKDGSPSPWSIVFIVDRVNKEIRHFVAISADQAFYVSPQLEPIVPVGGPMLLPRLHRMFFKSFGRRVVLFFFFEKNLFCSSPQVAFLLVESAREWSPGGFLGDEVLSYLHNMLLPETVGSNRDPLLAMSWFWLWLLAEEHPKSNLQLLFVTKFWKMLCEVYALRSQPPGAITVSPEGRVQAGRENLWKFPNRCWATT